LLEENKQLSHELKQFKRASLKTLSKELLSKVQQAGPYSLIAETVALDTELLPELIEDIMAALRSGIILLGVKMEGRCQLVAKVSSDLTQKGIQAVQLIKEIAPSIGGSGGGKAEAAQAGGKHPEGLKDAYEIAKQWLTAKT
jgi:alanyl-tRNA synthetase